MRSAVANKLVRLSALSLVIVLAGCHMPRIKSLESYQSATTPDPPRDLKAAPVDPYGYAGIADGSGGRMAKTTYGAGAKGEHIGASEIYGLLDAEELAARKRLSTEKLDLVPDPSAMNVRDPYLASVYLSATGQVLDLGPMKGAKSSAPAKH